MLWIHVLSLVLTCFMLPTADGIKCFELRLPLCQGFGYTATTIDYEKQQAMQAKIAQITQSAPAEGSCGAYLRPFLCLTFAPKCRRKFNYGVRPCRSACQFIQKRCRNKMADWPAEELDCPTQFSWRSPDMQCLSTGKLKLVSKVIGAKPVTEKPKTTESADSLQTSPPTVSTSSTTTHRPTVPPKTTLKATSSTTTQRMTTPTTQQTSTTQKATQKITTTTTTTKSPQTDAVTEMTYDISSTSRAVSETMPSEPETPTASQTTTAPVQPSPVTTTETAWVAKIVHATTEPTTTPAPPASTTTVEFHNFTGPVFNPFYPPTFATVDDPRKRPTIIHPTTTAETTTRQQTTASTTTVPTPTGLAFNVTTTVPWYHKVNIEWLVKQLDHSIRQARGDPYEYTKEWDLSNYSKVLTDLKEENMKSQPWYIQDYRSILAKVNITAFKIKAGNGTISEEDSAQIQEAFEEFFGLANESGEKAQADAEHSDEGVVQPVYVEGTQDVDLNKTLNELAHALNELKDKYYDKSGFS